MTQRPRTQPKSAAELRVEAERWLREIAAFEAVEAELSARRSDVDAARETYRAAKAAADRAAQRAQHARAAYSDGIARLDAAGAAAVRGGAPVTRVAELIRRPASALVGNSPPEIKI